MEFVHYSYCRNLRGGSFLFPPEPLLVKLLKPLNTALSLPLPKRFLGVGLADSLQPCRCSREPNHYSDSVYWMVDEAVDRPSVLFLR